MLSARVFSASDEWTLDDPSRISDEVETDGHLVWVDVVDATPDDFAWIESEFHLHPLAMEDARQRGRRPKLALYATHSFVRAYAALGDTPADLPEVDVFVGPDWLVTMRFSNQAGVHFDLDGVRQRYQRTRTAGPAVGFLLYSLIDEIVDGYFDVVDQIEDDLEGLEAAIFQVSGTAERTIQPELLKLRRKLLEFRRRVVPLRDVVFAILRREVPWVDETNLVYFQDVLNHLLRVIDSIDNERELLGNAVDAHLATAANRMNDIMKKMTSWGAILICTTLITGVYGMNFENLPLLKNDWGYPIALGFMLFVTLALYAGFKRKDWL